MNETETTTTPATVPEVKKWQQDPADPAGKIQCKRFNDAWRHLTSEHHHFIEKSGVIGVSERETGYWSPFGGGNRLDVTAACAAVGAAFNWTVSRANVGGIVAAITAALPALQASRPVKDERITAEADGLRTAAIAKAVAERDEAGTKQLAGFLGRFGNGQERVTIPLGQMGIVAELNYEDSDSMSDYFNRHASIGPDFLLAIVPEGRENESKLRAAVARYPELAGIPFKWNTEKYSGGHGNYLEATGGWVELTEELTGGRKLYRGGQVQNAGWEITYVRAYRDAKEPRTRHAFKGWPGVAATPATVDSEAGAGQAGTVATVSENREKGGIELRFPSKPAASVLENLKAHGWRWSRFSSCWYKTASDEARKFAARVAGVCAEQTATEITDPAGSYVVAQEEAYADNQAAMIGA